MQLKEKKSPVEFWMEHGIASTFVLELMLAWI
jgi:hypothetical protein